MVWDSSGSDRTVNPSSGSTEITAELRLDRDSARYLRFPAELADHCNERLEMTGELTVRTADGAIDDTSTITLHPGGWISALRELDEHGGTLDVERDDAEVFLVAYSQTGAGESCAGRVSVHRQIELSVRGERSVDGQVYGSGTWSNNGCGVGEERIRPVDPIEEWGGASPLELVQSMFGDMEIAGRWQDDRTPA